MSTDEEIEDADDLSEVSLMSQGDVTPAELENVVGRHLQHPQAGGGGCGLTSRKSPRNDSRAGG